MNLLPDNQSGVQRLAADDQATMRAVSEFVDWCSRNIGLLEQGRKSGIEFAVSPAVKDAIALSADSETSKRINFNLGDFKR